jgi:hypothetical protein
MSLELLSAGGDRKNYSIKYDQEIPTLIRYGSIISGCLSHSAYIGLIKQNNSSKFESLDIGYNVTTYDLEPPMSMGRAASMFGFGFIPLYPDYLIIFNTVNATLVMLSPVVGYTYSNIFTDRTGCDISINGGPVYAKRIKSYASEDDAENDEIDYYEYLKATEAMHDVPGHWGGRINPKVRLYYIFGINAIHLGLHAGYTHFIFNHNHFNSYDLGMSLSLLF